MCDHAACAPFVAGKLHKFFHGVDPSPTRRAELATIFRNANLEIRPLVEAILRDPMFFDPSVRMNRAKLPVEWVTARVRRRRRTSERRVAGERRRQPRAAPVLPAERRRLARRHALAGGERTRSRGPDLAHDGPVLAEITNARRHGRRRARTVLGVRGVGAATRAALDPGRAHVDHAEVAAVPPPPRPDPLHARSSHSHEADPAPQGAAVGPRSRGRWARSPRAPRPPPRSRPDARPRRRPPTSSRPPRRPPPRRPRRPPHHDDDHDAAGAGHEPGAGRDRHGRRARRQLARHPVRRRRVLLPPAVGVDPGRTRCCG